MPRAPRSTRSVRSTDALVAFYRRAGETTIYARTEMGRCFAFTIDHAGTVRTVGRAITSLAPIFGRVDFGNNVRFTGRTRRQSELEGIYLQAGQNDLLSTNGWVDLPRSMSASRRTSNQGMTPAVRALAGQGVTSASEYAHWYGQQQPGARIGHGTRWEWCHLLAHSMGGHDHATNVIAARRGNNSEQLAIESALLMYRNEQAFTMKIKAVKLSRGRGRYLANVIVYRVKHIRGSSEFRWYLDGLNAPNPSSIHYYSLLRKIALWANRQLVAASEQLYGNRVSAEEIRRIREYVSNRV